MAALILIILQVASVAVVAYVADRRAAARVPVYVAHGRVDAFRREHDRAIRVLRSEPLTRSQRRAWGRIALALARAAGDDMHTIATGQRFGGAK